MRIHYARGQLVAANELLQTLLAQAQIQASFQSSCEVLYWQARLQLVSDEHAAKVPSSSEDASLLTVPARDTSPL